jgi:enamine deaminase RidA (YjgF/YER057c/UK114 family)
VIKDRLASLGYDIEPAPLVVRDRFHAAVRHGDLVFTSGHTPALGDERIYGKVGADVDLATARRAAEICTVNCLRAVAAVADLENISQVLKVFGMVNVADGFHDTPSVINACSELLANVLGDIGKHHARSAVGMVLPGNWAVEIEMVVALK